MMEYKRLTKQVGWHKDIDLKDELGYSYIYQRLAELENKIEQETLIELPCKVGDEVYVVYRFPDCWEEPDFEYDISVEKVHDIIITEDGFDIGTECGMIGKFERICVCITREEAEKRLKELQERTKR